MKRTVAFALGLAVASCAAQYKYAPIAIHYVIGEAKITLTSNGEAKDFAMSDDGNTLTGSEGPVTITMTRPDAK